MIQGTTPVHKFDIPFDTGLIDEVKITYKQNNETILTKRNSECTLNDKTITTKLSQEETFSFTTGHDVKLQIRVLTTSGDAFVSDIFVLPVYKCLDSEVLV